jgi:hypothetical protein
VKDNKLHSGQRPTRFEQMIRLGEHPQNDPLKNIAKLGKQ